MKKISRNEASDKIKSYFSKDKLSVENTRKIKRLAMKFNIKLGKQRTRFCKKCYADLHDAKIRITKDYRISTCMKCGFANKTKIS